MKHFLDLLDTDRYLDVEIVVNSTVVHFRWPLLVNLDFSCRNPSAVKVDGMDVISYGWYQDGLWRIKQEEPFYRWRHRVTGQGWLLDPI